jgi:hypothetical protein
MITIKHKKKEGVFAIGLNFKMSNELDDKRFNDLISIIIPDIIKDLKNERAKDQKGKDKK